MANFDGRTNGCSLSRQQLLDDLQDLYGYMDAEFDGMTQTDILDWLSPQQRQELAAYNQKAFRFRHKLNKTRT
jgi:hypothetical protein